MKAFAVSETHDCAVAINDFVWCWGWNAHGEMGLPVTPEEMASPVVRKPTVLEGTTDAVELALGADHSCARLQGGGVRCWGDNRSGQLGIGSITNAPGLPTRVPALADVDALVAYKNNTCARLRDQSVMCWGAGELLGRDSAIVKSPLAINEMTHAAKLVLSATDLCALLVDGRVRCMGWNSSGQLANGKADPGFSPPSDIPGFGDAL